MVALPKYGLCELPFPPCFPSDVTSDTETTCEREENMDYSGRLLCCLSCLRTGAVLEGAAQCVLGLLQDMAERTEGVCD